MGILLESKSPIANRSVAELTLRDAGKSPGFLQILLEVVANPSIELPTRHAGALFFKNEVKQRWSDEVSTNVVPEADKIAIKSHIIQVMTTIPPNLQKQIGDAVTIIAACDFPSKWETLIKDLIANTSRTDMRVTNGVLQTAHSIFKRWRSQVRTNELFTEIAFVLKDFCEPFLSIMKQTDHLVQENSGDNLDLEILFETLLLLSKVFYDLNCQDIPEFFEDHMADFMGIFHKYLTYNEPGHVVLLQELQSSICEIVELYTQRYEDLFVMLPDFVTTIWGLLTRLTSDSRTDMLVSKALSFLTCVIKVHRHSSLFRSPQILRDCVEKIVLPNISLRESDLELFEDDPIEFIRRDLEGSDSDTRRRSATEFLGGLSEEFHEDVTDLALGYVAHYLEQYRLDPAQQWQAKDTAMYLVSSIAVRGRVTMSGALSINPRIDIQQIFQENVLQDLSVHQERRHPILVVDAIKFVRVFRNQLTRAQISEVFPLLAFHLGSPDYVVFTYSAVTVDSLLSLRVQGANLFAQEDVATFSEELLRNLFTLVLRGQSPEKIAENDFLIKCILRIILTAQDTIRSQYQAIIQHLNNILVQVSKNPANPRFNHYLFESYGAIIRFVGPTSIEVLHQMEEILLPSLMTVLQADVTEFIPYVFQLLAQLVELHRQQNLSPTYHQLLGPILTPSLWDSRGNVPALVRLLQAFIKHDSSRFSGPETLEPVLGIFQNLINSKANDAYGFELIQVIYTSLTPLALQKYNHQIFHTLLMRLKNSKTEQYTMGFTKFIFYLSAMERIAGPEFVITTFEGIQKG